MTTLLQVIIDIVVAVTAIYGAAIGTINQLQLRRQMQRTVLVSVKQSVEQLPRIPDSQGGLSQAPAHRFTVQATNPGLTPVILKEAGMILPDKTILTQRFLSDRHDKQFPFELLPGNDHQACMDAYDLLETLKTHGITGNVTVRGYVMTPLKQYTSKKIRLNTALLANDIDRTEGSWRK